MRSTKVGTRASSKPLKSMEIKSFDNYIEAQPEFDACVSAMVGRRVAVLGHVRPDGDCIGSQVALCRMLRIAGAEAFCVNNDSVPRVLRSFVGDTPFLRADAWDGTADLVVSVDCADYRRFGSGVTDRAPAVALNIDHHISNSHYAARNIVVGSAAATGEVLATLFLQGGHPIDAVTAQALYLGIATDTGQFRFAATTAQVFDICRRLTELGADPARAALEVYENETFNRIQLLQRFLASLRPECGGRVMVGLIEAGVYEETGTAPEDSEGLVDYARSIMGVDVGILLEEYRGKVKGSLRAKDARYRCDQIAQLFSGGGHACAAGLNQDTTIAELYPRLLDAVAQQLAAVDRSND